MHILFIGYGKTSQRVAKQLFMRGHQISAVSRHPKPTDFADHMTQDIHTLDLSDCHPIDWVYVLLSPENSDPTNYRRTYLESVHQLQMHSNIIQFSVWSWFPQRGFMVPTIGRMGRRSHHSRACR